MLEVVFNFEQIQSDVFKLPYMITPLFGGPHLVCFDNFPPFS